MLNVIWVLMLASGFLIGAANGRAAAVAQAALTSAGRAVELSVGLLGILCLWSGLMKIADRSGLLKGVAWLAGPVLRLLFPELRKNTEALGGIVMNLSANFLGLGNAATPLGIKAMEELRKAGNGDKTGRGNSRNRSAVSGKLPDGTVATDAMCLFLVLNTSAIQLIPTTVMAIRSDAGSAAPAEIVVPIWIASSCAMLSGILFSKALSHIWPVSSTGRRG